MSRETRRYRHDGALGSAPGSGEQRLTRGEPDWSRKCFVCGNTPTVFIEKNDPAPLCGPCTWGDSETMNGNW